MGFDTLPLELTEHILGYTFPPDAPPDRKLLSSLARCNLVLNTWATPRLFKDLYIRIEDVDPCLEQLHEILDGRPMIATLVKSFTLSLAISSTTYENFPIYQDTHLPIILPQLKNLTHFALKVECLPDRSALDWDKLNQGWSSAIQNVCLLPRITKIELGHICFLKSGWVTHCKNLEDLGLWNILDSFGNPEGAHPWSDLTATGAPRIKRLKLDNINACVGALYQLGCFSNLQKMEVALSREQHVGTVRGIIEAASDTLEQLAIYRTNETPFTQLRYNFQSWTPLPVLRQLLIGVSYDVGSFINSFAHWAEGVLTLLEKMPPNCPNLETITLVASANFREYGPPNIYTPTDTWILLEQFCATQYPALRTLVLEFEDDVLNSKHIDRSDDVVPLAPDVHNPDPVDDGDMHSSVDVSERLGIASFAVIIRVKPQVEHLWSQ